MKRKMRLMLSVMIFIIILLLLISCQTTKYITVPLSSPPLELKIKNIDTTKDLIKSYRDATIKIAQWQVWYNIQVGSNYFDYKGVSKTLIP